MLDKGEGLLDLEKQIFYNARFRVRHVVCAHAKTPRDLVLSLLRSSDLNYVCASDVKPGLGGFTSVYTWQESA